MRSLMLTKLFWCCANDRLRNFLIITFVLLVIIVQNNAEYERKLPTRVIWAVLGKDADLPCDITPPIPSDQVRMVFWFKDNVGMPIYSLDSRGEPLNKSFHLATSDDLGSRSYFIIDDHPSKARLKIQKITPDDEGAFRCRVDFINSPTRNFKINLTLVVQPSIPKLFDVRGDEIIGEAGPFLEGQELFLSCEVKGGRPLPTLQWWLNDTILDSVVDSKSGESHTVNQLLTKVTRSLKGQKLQCRASSSEIAGDIVREVPINVYLKPNKVKIVTPHNLLSANKPETLRCETSGSYPPAKLSWTLSGGPIKGDVINSAESETRSNSIISLNVDAEDDGKELVCRASNPRFPGGYIEDRRQIHVAYPPKVAVRSDKGATNPVTEGTKMVLLCDIISRPGPHRISWYHEGHLVPYNETAGLLPIDHMLTLERVSKSSEGQYSCSATNTEGETYSPPYTLQVKYAPRCKKGYETMRVGAIPHKSLIAHCHVDAVPDVNKFSWTYNTSKGVLPVQGGKMQNVKGVSVLEFTPASMDIESLSCWASNDVGRQEVPCTFYIVPAHNPDSPQNCILRNTTSTGLEVACMAGQDGGLQQSFVLEVTDVTIPNNPGSITTLSDQGYRSPPLYRVLGDAPVFRLHSLRPGREYQLLVYAVNAKGRSTSVVLSNIRVEVPVEVLEEEEYYWLSTQQPSDENTSTLPENLTLILVTLAAAVVLLIVIIVTVVTYLACRRQPTTTTTVVMRQRRSSKPPDEFELSEGGFGEGFHRRSAQYAASLYMPDIDETHRRFSGPDLILAPVNFPPQSSAY